MSGKRKTTAVKSLPVSSISDVFTSDSTKEITKKDLKKIVRNLSPNCCLLVTPERELDLTFKNSYEMSMVKSALQEILKPDTYTFDSPEKL